MEAQNFLDLGAMPAAAEQALLMVAVAASHMGAIAALDEVSAVPAELTQHVS